MSQRVVPERKRKKKAEKLAFDVAAVFDVKPSEEISLNLDSARYKAQKGQGGDRRSG
jgi:hypothetical protein